MSKEHVMIDIETLGTESNCIVLSIGVVYFDENGLGDEFYVELETSGQFKKGRTVNPATLKWWLDGGNKIPLKVDETESIPFFLLKLMAFIKPKTKVWALGPAFDITILDSLFKDFNLKQPWDFWNVRDVRTVVELHPECRNTINDHNALNDAKNQANWVIPFLNKTKGEQA